MTIKIISKQSRIAYLVSLLLLMTPGCGQQESADANRLASATSPYLREHADNPVNWYEWGAEALQKARTENKPLLISIGYASCHWCHVMEEESFMDTAVARLMNEFFVPVKIDREQRPDIDQIYLDAAQVISGSAGWPLNAFAMPDGKPFFAGTYFPKDQWMALLKQVADAYRTEKEQLARQAEALTAGLSNQNIFHAAGDSLEAIDTRRYEEIFSGWKASLDFDAGGQKGAPKFPMPVLWHFLLQYHHLTGADSALQIVRTTLDQMARGGIYDHLGGGFARYATDARWRIPHFEKMLYDNAQLVSLYAKAFQITGDPRYRDVVQHTLAFVERQLTSEEGGFYSSVNADSDGEEGKYYTWSKDEIDHLLGTEAPVIETYYNVTAEGNFENGKNVLYITNHEQEFLDTNRFSPQSWKRTLHAAHKKLLAARTERASPSIDDKILTSWNALMLTAWIDAYVVLGEERHLAIALKNARFIEWKMLRQTGALWRSYHGGQAAIDGFLDDYAFSALAFIRLYEVTFDIHWLSTARLLADYALKHFADEQSPMFHYSSALSEPLVVSKIELADNVIPSSNSAMAEVLLLLGEYYQDKRYSERSDHMVRAMSDRIASADAFYANWARLAGIAAYKPFQVAITGDSSFERSVDLQRYYNPLAIYMGGDKENLPLLENKLVDGKTVIYVCRDHVCRLPVQRVADALQQLRSQPY